MKRTLSLVYGAAAYVLFLGVFLYLVAFTLNLAPHSVSGAETMPPVAAILVDTALVALFGLQHSIMARAGFKRWWTRAVPTHLERSTYVMIGSCMVALIVLGWQPIEGDLWNVTGWGMIALSAASLAGFATIPVMSFLTDHFHLFGLRQTYDYANGRPLSSPVFRERGPYKNVRHPMMLGFLLAFWATPHMTIGHLFLATLMTAYILAGIYFEERSLANEHGQAYRDYQARVPKLIPAMTTQAERSPVPVKTRAARVQ